MKQQVTNPIFEGWYLKLPSGEYLHFESETAAKEAMQTLEGANLKRIINGVCKDG